MNSVTVLAELARRMLSCQGVIVSIFNGPAALAHRGEGEWYDLQDRRALADPIGAGDLGMRFFVGIPLRDSTGEQVGTLAAIDSNPRDLGDEELDSLKLFARLAQRIAARCSGRGDLHSVARQGVS